MSSHATPAKRPQLGPTDTITLSSDPPDGHTPVAPKLKRYKSASAASPSVPSKALKENVSLSALPDRAQLEAERLARQRKLAPQAEPSSVPSPVRGLVPIKREVKAEVQAGSGHAVLGDVKREPFVAEGAGEASGVGAGSNHELRFWQGAMRKVTNVHGPSGSDLSLGDLIGPVGRPDLIKAIVTSFKSEVDWIASHFAPSTDLTLVLPYRPQNPPKDLPRAYHPTTTAVYPPTDQAYRGLMHVKLLVLVYETYCRVVVLTANLYEFDWTECDNAFYVHDFPRLPTYHSKNPLENPTHTSFSLLILQLLIKMGVPNTSTGPFRDYDFSSSAGVSSVVTWHGKYIGWGEMERAGGMAGLAKAVKGMGFDSSGKWTVEAAGSSIGQMPPNWLGAFYAACAGVSPEEWGFNEKRKLPADKAFAITKVAKAKPEDEVPVKVIFPSQRQVLATTDPITLGCSYWFATKDWLVNTFPRHLFHRAENKRAPIPQHTKQMLALREPAEDGGKHEGWMLLGSHNPTQAAWGKLQYPKGKTQPQMECYNWELSVVFRFEADSHDELEARATELSFYKRPIAKYGDDVPWQKEKAGRRAALDEDELSDALAAEVAALEAGEG